MIREFSEGDDMAVGPFAKTLCLHCGHTKDEHCSPEETDLLESLYLPEDVKDLLNDTLCCSGRWSATPHQPLIIADNGKTRHVQRWVDDQIRPMDDRVIRENFANPNPAALHVSSLWDVYKKCMAPNVKTTGWPYAGGNPVGRNYLETNRLIWDKLQTTTYALTSTQTVWRKAVIAAQAPLLRYFLKNHRSTPSGSPIGEWLVNSELTPEQAIAHFQTTMADGFMSRALVCPCRGFVARPQS